ncbi:MAG: glycosyltransferase [Pseudomonadota bacterium]
MSQPINLLMLVLNLDVGGQERMLIELATGLQSTEYRPMICCLETRGELASVAESNGIEVLALERRSGRSLGAVRQLRKLLRSRKVGLLHSHNEPALLFGAAATAATRVKHVHTKHGMGSASSLAQLLVRAALRTVDFAVSVSDELAERLKGEGVAEHRIAAISNAINLTPFLAIHREPLRSTGSGSRQSGPVIGHVARLSEIKNQKLLLQVFSRFRKAVPTAKLVIVGDGPERSQLENIAHELQVADAVQFLGQRTDIPDLLESFDWFALTSRSEGTPISVIEAMAAGLPVTATDVGGLAALVKHDQTGLLASLDDSDTQLENWLRLAGDETARTRMGARARDFVTANYGLSKMVYAYASLYHQALASPRERVARVD